MRPSYNEVSALIEPVSAEIPMPTSGQISSLAPSAEPQIKTSDLISDKSQQTDIASLPATTTPKTTAGGLRPAH